MVSTHGPVGRPKERRNKERKGTRKKESDLKLLAGVSEMLGMDAVKDSPSVTDLQRIRGFIMMVQNGLSPVLWL